MRAAMIVEREKCMISRRRRDGFRKLGMTVCEA